MKFFFLSSSNVHDDSLLIIPNVYAQEYNPTSDAYDNLINVLLPLLIISAYKILVFMSYFLARVFDSEVLLGRFVKSYDKSAIVRDFFHAIHKCFGYFAKVDNTRMLRFYIDEADKAIDDMDIKFMVADDFSFKDVSEITIRYNSNAPRSAHYIKNIRYSTSFLTIMVNDETMDYPLHGVQNNILFQTPKLLNGIILTMTFLEEENQ
uniref:Uncharacterized protein n=1 Tax=Rhizophagus irregularis (strain DAOM 181602 / DAOM 197198 / MUCL 43194) TaxID=747089 RepID=U9UJE4_RHIID